jgi:apolipoprotein N-acyltransferase
LIANFILALATSAMLVLAFPRFGIAWLAAVAIAPLVVAAAREKRGRFRFLLGYVAGIAYWFGVCYWIQFVLQTYGGLGVTKSWAAFSLFCLVKALHMGAFAWLAGFPVGKVYAIPAVAAIWVAIERTHAPLGFAWLALGNAGINMSVPMRLAPYTGVYGISFVFAMLATALAVVLLRRNRRELLWLVSLGCLYLLPPLPVPRTGNEHAIMVQPNLSEDREWSGQAVEETVNQLCYLSLHASLSVKGPPPKLLIWPEEPAPMYYYDDPAFREQASQLARLTHAWFLFGTVAYAPHHEPMNSAVLLSPKGDFAGRYDKMNLVPFGEFVPAWFGFVNKITKEAGDFRPGAKLTLLDVGDHSIGTFICYEAAFPHFVRRFTATGAELLVNISNDGYFGRTAARQQHLLLARMRAAENRRWYLRCTNDGLTAVIDPAGRVVQSLPPYKSAALVAQFSYLQGTTTYTRYGDWFVIFCVIGGAVAIIADSFPVYYKPKQNA